METPPLETLNLVMDRFQNALAALSCEFSSYEVECWSLIVVDSMSGPARLYHRADHILELSEGLDPLGVLAALYHDIVYYQVDGGLPAALHSCMSQYFNVINGTIYLSRGKSDKLYHAALILFGLEAGEALSPYNGQNEFLSALVALRQLKDTLSLKELVLIAVCIEATIPFRGNTSAMKTLEGRLRTVSNEFHLKLSDDDIRAGIHRAVCLGNKDVDNFAASDVGFFLKNTWKLMPESNERLARSPFYSVREYRIALQRMQSFLSGLAAQAIFCSFEEVPDQEGMAHLVLQAETNLALSDRYLQVKLLATVILECLSYVTGGDAPMIYLMGSAAGQAVGSKMEDALPPSPESIAADVDPALLDLFGGTAHSTTAAFDGKTSPLSIFVYRSLGDAGVEKGFALAKCFFEDRCTHRHFLEQQNPVLIQNIAQAAARIARSRRAGLLKWATKNQSKSVT